MKWREVADFVLNITLEASIYMTVVRTVLLQRVETWASELKKG